MRGQRRYATRSVGWSSGSSSRATGCCSPRSRISDRFCGSIDQAEHDGEPRWRIADEEYRPTRTAHDAITRVVTTAPPQVLTTGPALGAMFMPTFHNQAPSLLASEVQE